MARNECTPDQASEWQARYSEGYRTARGDITWNAGPRIQLIDIPAEDPYETGAEYVARHVRQAWAIGYAAAWRYQRSRELVSV